MSDDDYEQASEHLKTFIRTIQGVELRLYGTTSGPHSDEINLLERMWQLPARGES